MFGSLMSDSLATELEQLLLEIAHIDFDEQMLLLEMLMRRLGHLWGWSFRALNQ